MIFTFFDNSGKFITYGIIILENVKHIHSSKQYVNCLHIELGKSYTWIENLDSIKNIIGVIDKRLK